MLREISGGVLMLVGLTLPACSAEPTGQQQPGLTVREGQLFFQGEPYRGIGANYFTLFYQCLKDASDTSCQRELQYLAQAGIPFVRFMACGFWPVEWKLYQQDKDAYFRLLDAVITTAEVQGVGLIPSLFWNMATVPDLVGEPMDQLGNPDSRTIALIRRYTEEVVLRYRNSPAIWGWEFGNEYNLHVDLPNASEHRPPVWPALKTALQRTECDELSAAAMLTALSAFAEVVRQHDQHRIIITGNSLPRPSAWHNSCERSWKPDSAKQFRHILLRDNPEPFPVICVHVYPEPDGYYPASAKDLADVVRMLQEISVTAGKPLFIGEFGASAKSGRGEEHARFLQLLSAIEAHHVPLSAFWVYDHPGQDGDWNVTFDNDRRYMLELVGAANRHLRRGGEKP